MGEFANPLWLKITGYAVCTVIAALNLKLLWDIIGALWFGVMVAVVLLFIAYVMFFYKEKKEKPEASRNAEAR
jgi:manganese transport protein